MWPRLRHLRATRRTIAGLLAAAVIDTELDPWGLPHDCMDGGLTTGGLRGILVVTAGVVLLVTGACPRRLFALIIGCNRWIYRVGAYAALMTEQYPRPASTKKGPNPCARRF